MPLPDAKHSTDLSWPPVTPEIRADRDTALAWWLGTIPANYVAGSVLTPDTLMAGTRAGDWPLKKKVSPNLVADIARTNADLLFGNPPDLDVTPADTQEDSATLDGLSAEEAKAATARIKTLMEDGGGWGVLAQAAEIASATGNAYLVATWDPAIADHAILTMLSAYQVHPEFRLGRLVAATIARTVYENGTAVWRWLQRHEPPGYTDPNTGLPRENAVIWNGLYVGTKDKLGAPHPQGLLGSPTTAGLPEVVEVPGRVRTVWHLPNKLPNPRDPQSAEGVSDTYGSEDLLGSLAEAYRAIPNDVRLSKKRLVVSQSMLETSGLPGSGAYFDMERDLMTPLNFIPKGDGSDSAGITPIDFTLQTDKLLAAAAALEIVIIGRAGYSPQTFGYQIEGSAESGTALRIREGKTIATVTRKRRVVTPIISEIAEAMLAIDAYVFNRETPVARHSVGWGPVREDDLETAQVIETLDRAGALTTEDKVKMAQPELSDEDVAAKVAKIDAAHVVAPDPFRSALTG